MVNDLKDRLHIIEENFDLEFLLNADEAFICSSGKEVVSVVQIGEHMIGNGNIGEIAKLVLKEFREYVSSNKW